MVRGYKRRNYFINRELQGSIIFIVFLISLLGVAFFTLILAILATDHLTIAYTDQQFRVGSTPLILLKELIQANWIFIITGGGVVCLLMLFVSHRLAGPLYRLENALKGLRQKDLNQHVLLRGGDVCRGLANEVNEFSRIYSQDIKRLQELTALLQEELRSDEKGSARQLQEEMTAILARYQLRTGT